MKQLKKKRILIVLYYYLPYVSGVTIYAQKLAETLAKKGYEVTVFTSKHEKKLKTKEIINGVVVVRHPVLFKLSKGVIMPTFWLKAARLAKNNDIFNPHLPLPDTGLSCFFVPRKKIFTTYHCDIKLSKGLIDGVITKLSFYLMTLQLQFSKSIITQSKDYFFSSKMSRFINKATAIYPPINSREFKFLDSTSLKNKLKIDKSSILIGYFGRVVYEKGIDFLLESIPELNKKMSNFKIIVGGEFNKIAGGGVKEQLNKYIDMYPDKIIFTGYLDNHQRQQFYSMIDVLVLPSIDPLEAFGMVQVEAMLCGTPVIASNIPGVREVIKQTGYGLLSEPKNSKDIADKIVKLLGNPLKYKPKREVVKDKFSLEKSISKYEELFK